MTAAPLTGPPVGREVAWAFAYALRGPRRNRPSRWRTPGVVATAHGVTVIRASRHLPFGRSEHRSSTLTHLVDGVYTAWRRGRRVGVRVRWQCGQTSSMPRLFSATTQGVCPRCLIAGGGR